MGDDELRFTDEEARCWANDPNNQAHEDRLLPRAIVFAFVLLIGLMVIAFLGGFRDSKTPGEESPIGCLTVRAVYG